MLAWALLITSGLLSQVQAVGPRQKVKPANTSPIVLHYDFARGASGWRAGFADYSPKQAESYALEATINNVPAELREKPAPEQAFYIKGHNRSDDLVMFLTRKITKKEGIKPGQRYRLEFSIALASNAESGCAGIGGKPGESVYLKVGGTPSEPKGVPASDDPSFLRMNADIGAQSQSGSAATVIGNIANGNPCSGSPTTSFRSFHRTGVHRAIVTADKNGELYLLVGTDSGFEGLTQLFYRRIQITLTPVNE